MERPAQTQTTLMVSGIGGLLLTTDAPLANHLAADHDLRYTNTSIVTKSYLVRDSDASPQLFCFRFPEESYELFETVRAEADETRTLSLGSTDATPTEVYSSGLREFRLQALRTLAQRQDAVGLGAYHEHYSYQWLDDLVHGHDLPVLADIERYLDARPDPKALRWYSDMRTYLGEKREESVVDYFLFQIGKHATGQARIDHAHERKLREDWPFYQTNANNA